MEKMRITARSNNGLVRKNMKQRKEDHYISIIQEKEFWFVVGSQHLYGEEALQEVKANAQKITDALNESGVLPYPIKLQELAVNAEKITSIMKEVNYRDEVAGVITWMHTFSPAKMWIRGTKLLQKPLLHLRSEEHTSELQSRGHLVCRLLLEKN